MAEDSRKLFVAGLPDSITEDVLKQLFEATGGSVVEVTLPRDRTTGRPRGFGFVTMSTVEEATSAREALHGSFQGGRSISVRPFESDPPRREGGAPSGPRGGGGPGGAEADKERKLYVGNLPYDATAAEVEAAITSAGGGPVQRIILPSDGEGKNRGYGFVQFASVEAARSALEVLRGAELRGRLLRILPAHDKGERPPPSRDGGFGGGRDFGGGGRDFGPPRSGDFRGGDFRGGGGEFPGGPPREGGPPRDHRDFGGRGAPGGPSRKTFDDRRRKHDDGGGGGGRGRRNKNDWDTKDDWDE